jgi:diguanylate cyclase (GGDEF)-like protein
MLMASGVTCLSAILSPPKALPDRIITDAFPVFFAALSLVMNRWGHRMHDYVFSVILLFGDIFLLLVMLRAGIGVAAGQIFFCLPILYAASQFREFIAYCTLLIAIACDTVLLMSLEPFDIALRDWSFAIPTYVSVAFLLLSGGRKQRHLAEQLRQQAAIDPLTGLSTRYVLDEAAQSAMVGSNADGTALILIDVDRFKLINDTYGHPIGDDALIHIASVVASHARPDSVISRIGGDEIALLLPGCRYEVAAARAREIVSAIENSPLAAGDGRLVPLTVSAGVAHSPLHADELRGLYTAADAALYHAKHRGRNQVGAEMAGDRE